MTELNGILRDAVQAGCNNYSADVADFTVRTVFDLDPAVGELSLVETDFGEAMLNLVRNACYAMELKKEASDVAYEPILAVSSRLVDDMVEIRVRDNGTGIKQMTCSVRFSIPSSQLGKAFQVPGSDFPSPLTLPAGLEATCLWTQFTVSTLNSPCYYRRLRLLQRRPAHWSRQVPPALAHSVALPLQDACARLNACAESGERRRQWRR